MNNSNAQITPLDCLSILLVFKALLHIDEDDQYSDCSKNLQVCSWGAF